MQEEDKDRAESVRGTIVHAHLTAIGLLKKKIHKSSLFQVLFFK